VDKAAYDEYIKGFVLLDCSVGDRDNIAFGMKQDIGLDVHPQPGRDETAARVLSYAPKRLAHQSGFGRVEWAYGVMDLHPAYDLAARTIIACDTEFEAWETGREFAPVADPIDDYTRLSLAAAFIDGSAYITGHLRKVFKRVGPGQWLDLTREEEHPHMFADLRAIKARRGNYADNKAGFEAIAGFGSADLYAGGRYGDLWHYDGTTWRMIDFPSNASIAGLCGASDGQVYAACDRGGLFRGRGDTWEELPGARGIRFSGCAWFDGRLWLGEDYALYVCDPSAGGKVERYRFPTGGPQQYSFRGVAASADVLVSYGNYQALVYDGKGWTEIIGNPDLFESNDAAGTGADRPQGRE